MGFREADFNSRVNARVVANIDAGRTYGHTHKRMENQIPISRHASGRSDKNEMTGHKDLITPLASSNNISVSC